MEHVDWWFIIYQFGIPLVLVFVAWLVKSPIFKHVPKAIQRVLADLHPDDLKMILGLIEKPENRRALVVSEILRFSLDRGKAMSYETAGKLLDQLLVIYGHLAANKKALAK